MIVRDRGVDPKRVERPACPTPTDHADERPAASRLCRTGDKERAAAVAPAAVSITSGIPCTEHAWKNPLASPLLPASIEAGNWQVQLPQAVWVVRAARERAPTCDRRHETLADNAAVRGRIQPRERSRRCELVSTPWARTEPQQREVVLVGVAIVQSMPSERLEANDLRASVCHATRQVVAMHEHAVVGRCSVCINAVCCREHILW